MSRKRDAPGQNGVISPVLFNFSWVNNGMSPSLAAVESGKQASQGAPTVRTAAFEDYSGIAALYERHGFTSRSFEEWASLWIGNPLYNELTEWPIGWVLEDENRTIVGYLGNIPLPYIFGGRHIVAATSRAWVVDPGFRSYSFSLLSRFFRQKSVDLFLNTTVNANATKGYEAFRVSRVPVGAWDQSIFWITNYRGFATSALANRRVFGWKLLSFPVSLGLFAQDKLPAKRLEAHRYGVSLTFVNGFDARFDNFWEKLLISNSDILLAMRSREILDWHFRRALTENRAWVLVAEADSQLIAYAIFLRRDNKKVGLDRLRLIDFQSLPGRYEVLRPMLGRALDRCRMESVDMLEVIGLSPERQRAIDNAGRRRRSLPSWLYFYKANDDRLAEALKDPRSWDPSCFDGDASL